MNPNDHNGLPRGAAGNKKRSEAYSTEARDLGVEAQRSSVKPLALSALLILVFLFQLPTPVHATDSEETNLEFLAQWSLNHGSYLLDVGKYLEALEAFDSALESSTKPSTQSTALLYRALALSTFLDDPDQALEVYKQVQKKFPAQAETAAYREGLLLFDLSRYSEARRILGGYLKAYPDGRYRFQVEALLEQTPPEPKVVTKKEPKIVLKPAPSAPLPASKEKVPEKPPIPEKVVSKPEPIPLVKEVEKKDLQTIPIPSTELAREVAPQAKLTEPPKPALKPEPVEPAIKAPEKEQESKKVVTPEPPIKIETPKPKKDEPPVKIAKAPKTVAKTQPPAKPVTEKITKPVVPEKTVVKKVTKPAPKAVTTTIEQPTVRVLLFRRTPELKIRGNGLRIKDTRGILEQKNATIVTLKNGKIRIGKQRANGSSVSFVATGPIELQSGNHRKTVRGEITVSVNKKKLRVVNRIGIESYLRGVVPSEAYASWPLETLKSQAVAARTYVLYQIQHRKKRPYDVVDNEGDQAYKGTEREDPRTDKAVRSTAGQILTKPDSSKPRPILAMYSANSGGHTADAKAIFRVNNKILKAHPDPWSLSGKMATWTRRHEIKKIEKGLARVGVKVKNLQAIEPVTIGPSGRLIRIKLIHNGKPITVRSRPVFIS